MPLLPIKKKLPFWTLETYVLIISFLIFFPIGAFSIIGVNKEISSVKKDSQKIKSGTANVNKTTPNDVKRGEIFFWDGIENASRDKFSSESHKFGFDVYDVAKNLYDAAVKKGQDESRASTFLVPSQNTDEFGFKFKKGDDATVISVAAEIFWVEIEKSKRGEIGKIKSCSEKELFLQGYDLETYTANATIKTDADGKFIELIDGPFFRRGEYSDYL